MSATQRVTIVGPNLSDQSKGEFHVHAEGCADLTRSTNLRNEDHSFIMEADSRIQVCDAIYDPDEFDCNSGEFVDEFHFAPCVHLTEAVAA